MSEPSSTLTIKTTDEFYKQNKKLVRFLMFVMAEENNAEIYLEKGFTPKRQWRLVVLNNYNYCIEFFRDEKEKGKEQLGSLTLTHYGECTDIKEVVNIAINHLSEVVENIDLGTCNVLAERNKAMVNKWTDGEFKGLYEFTCQRDVQENIFTRAQLVSLIEELMQRNPREKTKNAQKFIDNYKARYNKIQYIGKKDLETFLVDVKKMIREQAEC